MLNLTESHIFLAQRAENKDIAIEMVAAALADMGYVEADYVQGMLAREQQTSTFLGNGIAIPHGTLATRKWVKQTGVAIFQFPQGIDWGNGDIAYIVIGIAAQSDEHLTLLRHLTHLLGDEKIAQQLATCQDPKTFLNLLSGQNEQAEDQATLLSADLISLNVDNPSLLTLIAINAGKLQEKSAVENAFVSEVIGSPALPLGQGLWVTDSVEGNVKNAVAFSRAKTPFEHNNKTVSGVLTIAAKNDHITAVLSRLLAGEVQQILLKGSENQIVSALNGESVSEESLPLVVGTFTVRNEQGLHARPSTILVNTLKPFNAKVSVENLDRATPKANAKSLMKVVALGATKGQRLRFVAEGNDAYESIKALSDAFAAGLGEVTTSANLAEADNIEVQYANMALQSVMLGKSEEQKAVESAVENAEEIRHSPTAHSEVEAVVIVKNEHGLHARPSAVLVNEVKKYNASVAVQNLDRQSPLVSAKSLMKIVALGAAKGHRLRFVATGEQAQQAIDGICAAINSGLGE